MRNVFRELDKSFNHIMVHTGQHYDDELSKVFFDELDIRKPDYTLDTGVNSKTQYEQLSYLSTAIIELFKKEYINPDLVLFLGDSNSALASLPLFKEGYKIGHIEGGMRSYDRRMPEEINRVICDYLSDFVFVYTPLYKERLVKENKNPDDIYVVGNTITEIANEYMPIGERKRDYILADIHRNENLSSVAQYDYILSYLSQVSKKSGLPVKLVKFNRGLKLAEQGNLYSKYPDMELIGPYGFLKYLELQYHAYGVISDSGTSQEECPLLGVPAVIPRNFTERPESVENGNSILVGEHVDIDIMVDKTIQFFQNYHISPEQVAWLGDGTTSKKIVKILQEKL
jgi:UDP-N-acetylglucosamine 2-epimerase (non-hydrolysing)